MVGFELHTRFSERLRDPQLDTLTFASMSSQPDAPPPDHDATEIDPIWTSSRTARQIMALMEVERVRHALAV